MKILLIEDNRAISKGLVYTVIPLMREDYLWTKLWLGPVSGKVR